jgi:hypothetical protein
MLAIGRYLSSSNSTDWLREPAGGISLFLYMSKIRDRARERRACALRPNQGWTFGLWTFDLCLISSVHETAM